MIIKVKELQFEECVMLCSGQVLFIYLYLVVDMVQIEVLICSGATCIVYEMVIVLDGSLSLLILISEVVGCMLVQVGVVCLQKVNGGSGILLGGVS